MPRAVLCLVVGVAALGAPVRPAGAQAPTLSHTARPQTLLPGTSPDVLVRIQGNALDSTNRPMANAVVRLRDARVGRIVASVVTDQSGLFAFGAVDPGSYIVELLGEDGSVLASSQMLNVDAGEVISAIVKLPFQAPPFGGLLGHSAASAAAVTAAAATSGVLAATVAGDAKSP